MGGEEPIGRAYLRWRRAFYGYLLTKLRNRQDAEDCLQDIFIELWIRGTDGILDLDAYLWRRVRDEAWRRRGRSAQTTPVFLHVEPSAHDPLEHLAFEEALAKLPDEQHDVFVLIKCLGFTLAETADNLQISYETAAGRLRYAIAKLRRYL